MSVPIELTPEQAKIFEVIKKGVIHYKQLSDGQIRINLSLKSAVRRLYISTEKRFIRWFVSDDAVAYMLLNESEGDETDYVVNKDSNSILPSKVCKTIISWGFEDGVYYIEPKHEGNLWIIEKDLIKTSQNDL